MGAAEQLAHTNRPDRTRKPHPSMRMGEKAVVRGPAKVLGHPGVQEKKAEPKKKVKAKPLDTLEMKGYDAEENGGVVEARNAFGCLPLQSRLEELSERAQELNFPVKVLRMPSRSVEVPEERRCGVTEGWSPLYDRQAMANRNVMSQV